MFSYVDAGKEELLPRYEELRSLEVVHCGATEPRPGGHVQPPALRRLPGAPMRRDLIRPSTNAVCIPQLNSRSQWLYSYFETIW